VKKIYYFNYPLCRLGIAEEDSVICRVFFDNVRTPDNFIVEETSLINKTSVQLKEYFDGKRKTFDLPIVLHGTDFQVRVWNELINIPWGETRSYGELAAIAGNRKASRAVGMANNRNPLPIIIPCHRVIGHDGSLTGYAGGIELKKHLLELEKNNLF
jgi:methylated-DNA-[protein]-cysteine S-methyltransferase